MNSNKFILLIILSLLYECKSNHISTVINSTSITNNRHDPINYNVYLILLGVILGVCMLKYCCCLDDLYENNNSRTTISRNNRVYNIEIHNDYILPQDTQNTEIYQSSSIQELELNDINNLNQINIINSSIQPNIDNLCPICLDNERNIAFDCGHLICNNCNLDSIVICPICRKDINIRLRIYL